MMKHALADVLSTLRKTTNFYLRPPAATALGMKPEVLLLDEPSTGLEEKTKARLIDVLSNLDLSYTVISHEDVFYKLTDSIYTMENGAASGPSAWTALLNSSNCQKDAPMFWAGKRDRNYPR